MRRAPLLAAALAAALLCTACSKSEPVEIPTPSGFDAGAAREVGESGNGLWLLDGPTAAGRVIDAMGEPRSATMDARVLERIPVEQGASIDGRVIEITSVSVGRDFEADVVVGDQSGEIVAVGDRVWLRGNQAFSERVGIERSEEFVCRDRALAEIDEFTALTEPSRFLRTSLIGLDVGTLLPEDGESTQTLVLGSGGAPIGEMRVERSGAPLPQRVFLEDQTGVVEAEFAWNDATEVQPPVGVSERGCG